MVAQSDKPRLLLRRIHIDNYKCMSKFMTHSDQTFELEVLDDAEEFRYVYKLIIEHERGTEKARVKKEELLLNDRPILKIEMGEAHMFSEETPNHEYREGPTFPFNWTISGFTLEFKEEFNRSLLLFRKWVQGIVALSPDPWQIVPSSISESVFLHSHAENFASWYRNNLLANYQNINEKVDTRIQEILPGYNGLHFHGTGGEKYRELKASFRSEKNEEFSFLFHCDQLSIGQIIIRNFCIKQKFPIWNAFFVLSILLFYRKFCSWKLCKHNFPMQNFVIVLFNIVFGDSNERLLLLDEPDNFLMLQEIKPLFLELEDAAGSELPQSIVISHHPEAMDSISLKNMVWLDRDPSSYTRQQDVRNDSELTISKLWSLEMLP